MTKKPLTLLAVGDIICDTSKPIEPLFKYAAPVLKSGDVVVGQGEIFFTSRGIDTFVDLRYPAKPARMESMRALPYAGFNVITLASNHAWDSGAPGVEDTINGLKNYGIAYTGAGMNFDEARRPAIIERGGVKFGFLAYNCVGPQGSWATAQKPGCAYVNVVASYEANFVGSVPRVYSFALPESLKIMTNDIRNLRPLCDVLVVALHKGIGFIPANLADYEQQVSYAALDAGADMILGHHAHILKGIELYKGKPIFHNLGHFIKILDHGLGNDMSPEDAHKFMIEFQKQNGGPFFFGPNATETPFPSPESDMTIIAKCVFEGSKLSRVSYIPCWINKQEVLEVLKHDERGQQVFDYVKNVTRGAGLNASFAWDGDEVAIS